MKVISHSGSLVAIAMEFRCLEFDVRWFLPIEVVRASMFLQVVMATFLVLSF